MKKTKTTTKKLVKKIKKPARKSVKKTIKKATKKPIKKASSDGQLIGKIIHYYDHIGVGIVELNKGGLEIGQQIHVKGHVTDFQQDVKSMQIEHEQINKAKKGDVIGLKIKDKAREGDLVYKI